MSWITPTAAQTQLERSVLTNQPAGQLGRPGSGEIEATKGVLGSSMARVTFNVGGVIFQTLESTVKDVPYVRTTEFASHYDLARGEFFFDRDPEVFRSVLNFWRTGRLHLPLGRCGPSVSQELVSWGLEELNIEPCCWNNFSSGQDARSSLDRLRAATAIEEESRCPRYQPRHRCAQVRMGLWHLLTSPSRSLAAKVYEYIAIVFSILAIFSFCASTSSAFQLSRPDDASNPSNSSSAEESNLRRSARVSPALVTIDYLCLAFFTLEYLLRLTCSPQPWRFVVTLIALIDLLAILPDYIEMTIEAAGPLGNTVAITDLLLLLRLMRVVRIFRVIRHVPGLWIMLYTLKASYKDLFLMLLFLLVGTLLFGSVIFFVDDSSVFTSIPQSFWWAIVTMTTVGYGDMVPRTPWGQLVGSMTTVCGVLLIGFTIPSLVNNFTVYYNLVLYDAQHKKLMAKKNTNSGGDLGLV